MSTPLKDLIAGFCKLSVLAAKRVWGHAVFISTEQGGEGGELVDASGAFFGDLSRVQLAKCVKQTWCAQIAATAVFH